MYSWKPFDQMVPACYTHKSPYKLQPVSYPFNGSPKTEDLLLSTENLHGIAFHSELAYLARDLQLHLLLLLLEAEGHPPQPGRSQFVWPN